MNLSVSFLCAAMLGMQPLVTRFDKVTFHRSLFTRAFSPVLFNVPRVSLVQNSFSLFLSPVLTISGNDMSLSGMIFNSRQEYQSVNATECLFTRVDSQGEGGVSIDSDSASASFLRCVFEDCAAIKGGAVFAQCESFTMTECCVSDCVADQGSFVFGNANAKFESLSVTRIKYRASQEPSICSLQGDGSFKSCNISKSETSGDVSGATFARGSANVTFIQSLIHDAGWCGHLLKVDKITIIQCNVLESSVYAENTCLLSSPAIQINNSVFVLGGNGLIDEEAALEIIIEASVFTCERPNVSSIVDTDTKWVESSPATLELMLLKEEVCDGFKPVFTTEVTISDEPEPTPTPTAVPTTEEPDQGRVNFVSVAMVAGSVAIVLVVLGGLIYGCCKKRRSRDEESKAAVSDVNEPLNNAVLNPIENDDVTKEMI